MKKTLLFLILVLQCLVANAERSITLCNTNQFTQSNEIIQGNPGIQTRADTQEDNWIEIGTGEWTDGLWQDTQSGNPLTDNPVIERSMTRSGVYRVFPFKDSDLYGSHIVIHCENPNKVYFEPFIVHPDTNTDMTIVQASAENGWTINKENRYGSMKDGTIRVPSNSFIAFEGEERFGFTTDREFVLKMPKGFDNPLGFTESGVYMGLISFNDNIKSKPISILNEKTCDNFTSFVDNMQIGNATLLYYSVDTAIDELESQSFPADLSNVVLITFTDGLDQGSLAKKPEYRTSRGYAAYLAERISKTKIQGLPLQAYAIGMRSQDVLDDELFMYNLSSLATPSANSGSNIDSEYVTTVKNIKELEDKLNKIYENLNKQTSYRDISISVPMMSHGDLYRFTLDNTKDNARNSDIWFEGVFNIDNMCLENVVYHGFTSTTGSTIPTSLKDVFTSFILKDCRGVTGELLDVDKEDIDQYTYIPSRDDYQHNTENTKVGEIKVEDHKTTVAIMFALDSSSSLTLSADGDLFPLVKSTANSFINLLAGKTNPSGINEVSTDNSSMVDLNDPEAEFFNLQGMKVKEPTKGIYIYRKGNTVKKIMVN